MVKNGIDFDLAEAFDDATRMAYQIAFGEIEGGKWEWARMDWKKQA